MDHPSCDLEAPSCSEDEFNFNRADYEIELDFKSPSPHKVQHTEIIFDDLRNESGYDGDEDQFEVFSDGGALSPAAGFEKLEVDGGIIVPFLSLK